MKTYKIWGICGLLALSGLISPVDGLERESRMEVIFNDVNLTVNERAVNADTMLVDGRTYIPVRVVAETLGLEVIWDQATMTASIQKGREELPVEEHSQETRQMETRHIDLVTDKISLEVEGTRVKGHNILYDGVTYVPLREISEMLDMQVEWDELSRTVSVNNEILVAQQPQVSQLQTSKDSLDQKKYDLRRRGIFTTVKDQGDFGTCWAYSAYGALEAMVGEEQPNFSEEHMVLNNKQGRGFDDGGNRSVVLGYLTSWQGPVGENSDEVLFHLQEAIFIEQNLKSIKEALITYGPVESGIYMMLNERDHLDDSAYNGEKHAYYYDGKELMNHSVVIVGWDDDYPKENFPSEPSRDGAYIVRNSMGDDWGEFGYFYVSYDDTSVGMEGVVYTGLEAVDNYDHVYQNDVAGIMGSIGFKGKEHVFMASTFENRNTDELLEAISFYNLSVETDYTLYYIDDFNGESSLGNGREIGRGTVEQAGYHTIVLDEAVEIKESEKFAIVVEMETPDNWQSIATQNHKTLSKDINGRNSQSYISPDGKDWVDTYASDQLTTCIKAFTIESK